MWTTSSMQRSFCHHHNHLILFQVTSPHQESPGLDHAPTSPAFDSRLSNSHLFKPLSFVPPTLNPYRCRPSYGLRIDTLPTLFLSCPSNPRIDRSAFLLFISFRRPSSRSQPHLNPTQINQPTTYHYGDRTYLAVDRSD
jgi:hypothetical protein